jgi:hypothetical protein
VIPKKKQKGEDEHPIAKGSTGGVGPPDQGDDRASILLFRAFLLKTFPLLDS